MSKLLRRAFYALSEFVCRKLKASLLKFSEDLDKNQEKVLLDILAVQKETEYGKFHSFEEIRSVEDFRNKVPVNNYEDLRPFIEKQDKTKEPIINVDNPYLYQVTSGTTGKAKLIPLLEKDNRSRRRMKILQYFSLYEKRPKFLSGKIFAIVAPGVEGYTENGTPYGSATGKMYSEASKLTRMNYVLPSIVLRIKNSDVRYRLILQLALQEEDISFLTTANPSTFILLIKLLNETFDEIVSDLRQGTFALKNELTKEEKEALEEFIHPLPERADFLEKLRKKSPTGWLRYSDIWKKIDTVSVWTGGSCAIFVDQLREEFDEHILIHDHGYLSSEFIGTFILEPGSKYGVPSVQYNFFEFVEDDDWDSGKENFIPLSELKEGKKYYIFVTTPYGLYRYNMSDIITVKGNFGSIPLMSFVQKGAGITSITGEKLHESQVIRSVQAMEKELNLASSSFFIMLADAKDSSYTLYYESRRLEDNLFIQNKKDEIVNCLEKHLFESNMEYECKRNTQRLKKLNLVPLSQGTYIEYRNYCVEERNQRREQFKVIPLQWIDKVGFDFKAAKWIEERDSITKLNKSNNNIHVTPSS